jgi:thiol-disulfide isomerase/thioredoxin
LRGLGPRASGLGQKQRSYTQVALFALASCAGVQHAPRVTDQRGLEATLAADRGHPVVMNVWATWCEPCVEEMPALADAARRHQPKGVRFVSVSADDPADLAAVKQLLAKSGAAFDTTLVVGGARGDAMDALIRGVDPDWSGALPATFIYDAAGKLVASRQGPVDGLTVDGWLAPLETP